MELSHLRVMFFGSSEFALPIFEALLHERMKLIAVVTQPDRPVGRDHKMQATPVKTRARSHKFEVLQYTSLNSEQALAELSALHADVAVVASYGQLIPREVLGVSRRGFLNIHPSLLPKYRGPSPIQSAILNGETTTGVSVMLLDDKMDHGPILAQKSLFVNGQDTYPTLHDRLSELGGELLVEVLPLWLDEKIEPVAQDDRAATFTTLLTRESGRINWRASAQQIWQHVKAYTPWPGSWSLLADERYKILEAIPEESRTHPLPGQLLIAQDKLYVGCGNTTSLRILAIQPEGRPIMSDQDYIRGYKAYSGQVLK